MHVAHAEYVSAAQQRMCAHGQVPWSTNRGMIGPIEVLWFATARASVQIRSDKDTRRASTVRATAALKDVEAQLENLTTAMAQGGKRSEATWHFGTSLALVSFHLASCDTRGCVCSPQQPSGGVEEKD